VQHITCDKCGNLAEEQMNISILEPHRCSTGDKHRFTTKVSYDLCDECIMKVIRWIEAEEPGEKLK
jgi:hypothetical protein